jgi:DNA-binding GntR family transcriptional regulator
MSSTGNEIIQRYTVVDNVTVRLRGALLAGEIKPGEKIRVAQLEKSFGVSHIPIREAVRRLEAEGLIVALPQRAAVAAGVDLDDLAGLYDLRRIIECEVIRRSVESMTVDQVETVQRALADLEAVVQDRESPRFWELHGAFHWALLEPGASGWVQRVVDQLWFASQRYVRLFVSETIGDAMEDHRDLARSSELRDGEGAARVLRIHLDRTELAVRRAFARAEPAEAGA